MPCAYPSRPSKKGIMGGSWGGLKMFEKSYVRKLGPRDWLVLFAIVVIGIAAIAMKQTNRPKAMLPAPFLKLSLPLNTMGQRHILTRMPANARLEPIWFFGRAVAQSRASLRACLSALLEISRLRIAVRIV